MADAKGMAFKDVPAGTPLVRPVHVQVIALTNDPGYSPGSFSNVLHL